MLCTEGASDTYAHETGPRIAQLLGWPVVTNVRSLIVDGGRLRAVRTLGAGTGDGRMRPPGRRHRGPGDRPGARSPGSKSVIAAGRKPTEQVPLADLGLVVRSDQARTSVTSLLGYVRRTQARPHRPRATRPETSRRADVRPRPGKGAVMTRVHVYCEDPRLAPNWSAAASTVADEVVPSICLGTAPRPTAGRRDLHPRS